MNVGHEIVQEGDNRPAGPPDRCFYCDRQMGERHKDGCVILKRTVVVRLTLEVILPVPRDWEASLIEVTYGGELSHCADNTLERLGRWAEKNENSPICACGCISAQFLREASEEDHGQLPCLD